METKQQWQPPQEPKKGPNIVLIGCVILAAIPVALVLLGAITGVIFKKPPPAKPAPPVVKQEARNLSPRQIVTEWLTLQQQGNAAAQSAWCQNSPRVQSFAVEEFRVDNEVVEQDEAYVAIQIRGKNAFGASLVKSATVRLLRTEGKRPDLPAWCIFGITEL